MPSRTMVIFATSRDPDPYVNALGYGVHHMDVARVEFILLSEHDYKPDSDWESLAHRLVARLGGQLDALADGKYLRKGSDGAFMSPESLATPASAEFYRRVRDAYQNCAHRVVPLKDLPELFRSWRSGEPPIVDVTALKKNLLSDVVALAIAYGFKELHSFELRRVSTHDAASLIDVLSPNADYVYRNLLNSAASAKAVALARRWDLTIRGVGALTAFVLLGTVALIATQGAASAGAWISVAGSVASVVGLGLTLRASRVGG